MKTIEEIDFQGKKALIRVDFNVPLDDNHEITDFTRIKAAIPTIKYVLDNGGVGNFNVSFGKAKRWP